MEPNDGFICFQNSELLCGLLDKKVLGGGKDSLFYILLRQYGPQVSGECMGRVAKLSARFMGEEGFSIGINDVTASETLNHRKQVMTDKAYAEVDELIAEYHSGTLESLPGMSVEKSLESKIQGVLSAVRNSAGSICVEELHKTNAPKIMTLAGSKGSEINIAQMVACVGQQIVAGSRIPDGFVNRSLPHFPMFAKDPAAKGFVANSFYSGLLPYEFWFHTMGGREGLVDTAVKTAETGYMQRRLMKAMEDLSIQWDKTCRTSAGDVVQFIYGEDGLDPTDLDDQNDGIDFKRQLQHTRAVLPSLSEKALEPSEIRKILAKHHSKHLEQHGISEETLKTYPQLKWMTQGGKTLLALADDMEKSLQEVDDLVKQKGENKKVRAVLQSQVMDSRRLTKAQITAFFKACEQRFCLAEIESGTACGALAGQSIGEPGTQMTLKTFHFAGVASMNVTMGVPRIKELINAAKTVSTPIVDVSLAAPTDLQAARIVKGRIEVTRLRQVAVYIKEVHDVAGSYISIKLDLSTISKLQLEINVHKVQMAIASQSKKLKDAKLSLKDVKVRSAHKIHVVCSDPKRESLLSKLRAIMKYVPHVQVCGLAGIDRAVISTNEKDSPPTYKVYVEGYGMENVYGISGVDGTNSYSNHIMEIKETLGIEAARFMIVKEMRAIFESYGIGIDIRHMWLLADTMTYRGEVLGITRFGIEKMRDSVLMLASFEKTADHLFEASVRSRIDAVSGVSECIIMGIPVPVGTCGNLKLLHTLHGNRQINKKQTLLSRSYKS